MLSILRKADEASLAAIAEEKRVRGTNEVFLMFSLGSHFDLLIKLKLEKVGVFCLLADPATVRVEDVLAVAPTGIVLSGGPGSVQVDETGFDRRILDAGIPTLGICLGCQTIAHHVGLEVIPADRTEYGTYQFRQIGDSVLFEGCPRDMPVLQNHGDMISHSSSISALGYTDNAPVAAAQFAPHLLGVLFHPEVDETIYGDKIFENFCFGFARAKDRFPAQDKSQQKIAEIREQVGDGNALVMLSGGTDSSTVAYLAGLALKGGKGKAYGLYVGGLDRDEDDYYIRTYFGNLDWLELIHVDATEQFEQAFMAEAEKLGRGLDSKDIRRVMPRVYEAVANSVLADLEAKGIFIVYVMQGTLYTDITETGGGLGGGAAKSQIKAHHNINNVFLRPDGSRIPELRPLSDCVKSGGRNIGRAIGVPEAILERHPFPGPGLSIRIEWPFTRERRDVARQADYIWSDELHGAGYYRQMFQSSVNVTSSVVTCNKGDGGTTGWAIELCAYDSSDALTARATELPVSFLRKVARRIGSEVRQVGRVSFNVTDKPYGTIERG